MQKLLNTIEFSKNMRRNILFLSELVDVATEFRDIAQVSRRIRIFQDEIRDRMNLKPNFLIRIELRALRQELKALRQDVAKKTVEILNADSRAA